MYTSREQPVIIDRHGKRKGIKAVAKELGVTYTHLYLVLAGKRESSRLMAQVESTHPELIK